MTQSEEILEYINSHGQIDRITAFSELGIFELAARIADLEKRGFRFRKTSRQGVSRSGRRYRYTVYEREVT